MSIDAATLAALAERLETARREARPIAKLTDEIPDFGIDDGYAVQYELRRRALAAGARLVGMKMGLTSRAKMEQMGVDAPVYGFLCDAGACPDGDALARSTLIHPRVEAEIAFVLKSPLRGPGCHLGSALAATDFVLPALEVIDSRYEKFRFDLPSVIADNTSASHFVLGGTAADPRDLDLRGAGVVVERDGEVVETGAGAAVLGHPAASVATLANLLVARGEELPAGAVILTGSAVAAVELSAGQHLSARFQGLGSVSLRMV